MRYGIISDIHSNLEALEAVREDALKEGVDLFFSSGDIVGYGANPNECLDIIKALNVSIAAGNHDWAAGAKFDAQYFNPLALEAIVWTKQVLSKENLAFLSDLELVFKNQDFILVHGSLDQPADFIYLGKGSQAKETFSLMDRNVCFIGHTHIPRIFIQQKEKIVFSGPLNIELQKGCKYIVNAGSVGQPRDRNPLASYCIFDSVRQTVEIKRVPYDILRAQKKIRAAGLPEYLAERLEYGE